MATARRVLLACLASLFVATHARAAGLYFSDRGVRPMGRGGAFVAGADDLGAVWYNPAGLADAGDSILFDASWLHFTSEFTRKVAVRDGSGAVRTVGQPTVDGTSPILPIPTLGISKSFGKNKEFTAAFAILAPYTAITSYPLAVNGQPAPSRYSLVSLDGSALAVPTLSIAYKPIERIRVGMGLGLLAGTFQSTVVFNAVPADRVIGAPEDPNYDALAQLKVGPILSPSMNFGATFLPDDHVRIGVSAQLPFIVDAPAKVSVRLPTAAPFDKASQQGDEGTVRFVLPAIVRAGAEYRFDFADKQQLRVEATYVREFWSSHDAITLTPTNMRLVNITGFPSPFQISQARIPRGFQDTHSIRLGGEFTTPNVLRGYVMDFRAGLMFEESAIPKDYVSPLTFDSDKIIASVGGSLHLGERWRLDAVFGYVAAKSVSVDPREAKVPRINPVAGNPTKTESINGGEYSGRSTLLGVGVVFKY